MPKRLITDERGGMTVAETITLTVLGVGAAALAGYGLTAMIRGKVGDTMNAVDQIKAMDGAITAGTTNAYSIESDDKTGIAITPDTDPD